MFAYNNFYSGAKTWSFGKTACHSGSIFFKLCFKFSREYRTKKDSPPSWLSCWKYKSLPTLSDICNGDFRHMASHTVAHAQQNVSVMMLLLLFQFDFRHFESYMFLLLIFRRRRCFYDPFLFSFNSCVGGWKRLNIL